jgi:Ca-activated chloride channel family protein
MGVTNSNKTLASQQMTCNGTLRVTLSLTAAPDIITNPTDIVLVLDRSGSMTGQPLADLKLGAKTFIDIIAEATQGSSDFIGSGSRIGIVSFASGASIDMPLTDNVEALKNAVDALTASGSTNHAAAFEKAETVFDASSGNAQVLLLFTDGNTTAGAPPTPIATQIKARGVIFYCIGLIGSDGVDVSVLNEWASDPDSAHVAVTPNAADLEELFAELAANISKPGATDIVINEMVTQDFTIEQILPPQAGSVESIDARTLRWNIPALGTTKSESAILEFFVRHTGASGGEKHVNESITYSDNEQNIVVFPDPTVWVDCAIVVQPEPCPTPQDFTVKSCNDSVVVDMGQIDQDGTGRIIQLDVTVKDVCPNRRTALAVILSEVDQDGMEHQRGMKAMTLLAHDGRTCRDILVKCIRFVVPEDLNSNDDTTQSLCAGRNFRVRFIAHSIDTDYRCCESTLTL